ncbi:MAG: DUF1015 domain-containing protein [Planctomycetota bacterium]
MPAVYPFKAVQYKGGKGDVSAYVAPPYDVLGAEQKAALLKSEPENIVGIDLPHVPAKELGAPEVYAGAAKELASMLSGGSLSERDQPAMFAYRESFEVDGASFQRVGMACTIETQPLGPREGGGVLPHEQTFSGPKADRMALMQATKTQLSPIFGLHPDDAGEASAVVRGVTESRSADMTATLADGVKHEVWTVDDEPTMRAYTEALRGEDVFIADGHHRYNTAVNYLAHLVDEGDVPADHRARRTMFVLVSMSDPGLYIGPTHRVLGGMKHYSIDAFQKAAEGILEIQPCGNDPQRFNAEIEHAAASADGRNVLGLMDFATGLCFVASPAIRDPLEDQFPDKPIAWRTLDVALVQHLIVDEICKPTLNDGEDVKWAFPHSIDEVMQIGRGGETGAGGGSGFAQLALIVRPTPMDAVRDVSHANELMPQKSTFFYPKLATGLFVNPLA